MENPTYLVTGGMGCLGAWTLHHLVRTGKRAVCFDLSVDRHRLHLLIPEKEQLKITFVQGDLTDYRQVEKAIEAHKITHIVHLAALQIPFCRANPVLGARVNVVGTVNIFEAARRQGISHLTYASSIAVYGAAEEYPAGPIAHDAPTNPHTLYGVFKVANEGTARIYWEENGISSIGLRPYTVYGVGRDQGLTSDPTRAMLAAVKGEQFEIGFSGTMQLQWASDVARQFILAAETPPAVKGAPVFNLGTTPVSIDEVVRLIRTIRPHAAITYRDTILPFPEAFADDALHEAMPEVFETPLVKGIRQTIEDFESFVADNEL